MVVENNCGIRARVQGIDRTLNTEFSVCQLWHQHGTPHFLGLREQVLFTCNHLCFLEIYLDLCEGTEHDFKILSFLIRSLSISLASPEHLKYKIWFCNCNRPNPYFPYTLYDNLHNVWSPLDPITIHPTSSWLQQVDINIKYTFVWKDLMKMKSQKLSLMVYLYFA